MDGFFDLPDASFFRTFLPRFSFVYLSLALFHLFCPLSFFFFFFFFPHRFSFPLPRCGDTVKVRYGTIVVVRRGECSFDEKCLNVQNGGGVACVIVNTDEKLPNMSGGADANQLQIPTIMIRKSARLDLETRGFLLGDKVKHEEEGDTLAHLARIVYTSE